MTKDPTPEEIAAAQKVIDQANAKAAKDRQEKAAAIFKPITDLGVLGEKIDANPANLSKAMREVAANPEAAMFGDGNLIPMLLTTAQGLDNTIDRVRVLSGWRPEEPTPEA